MTEWKSAQLKDLPVEIIDGDRSARYPKRDEFQAEGVPFLNTTNIVNNTLDLSDLNFVSEEKFAQIRKGRLKPLDIVMTTRGSVGKVALFDDVRYRTGLINAQMLILRADGHQLDSRFLYYLFCSDGVQGAIRNFSSGSAQPQIPIQDLRQITISYPPIGAQRRIAGVLSAYDDLIENNTRRIEILEEMAQAIYREWFVNFRFPGHEKVRMVDSPLGPIPEGWEWKTLGDLAQEVRRGVNPDELSPETPYFGLEHLPRKSIALTEWGRAGDVHSTKLAFHKGEILFGKIRPYFHKVGVAPVDGICSSDTIVIVSKAPEYSSLVLSTVSSEEFVSHATQTSQGTKMPRADWSILVKYPVAVPPMDLLQRFSGLHGDMVAAILNMVLRTRNLRQTRDLLLPKLICADVDVSGVDIPAEPPSE